MTEEVVSIDKVRELLSYDPISGVFIWRVRRGNRAAGAIADSIDGKGYIRIRIDGIDYRAHRLAWLVTYGEWPKDQIDHIDLNRTNNAILNLREANNSLNNFNRRIQSNNKSGLRGVFFDSNRGKWRAEIKKDGKVKHLGRYSTAEEASLAYKVEAIVSFGEFARMD